jgi:tetratricopeptide (TPR) repeat protein/tRNA A-37 threonylcarbamoyl transferase component Bud32
VDDLQPRLAAALAGRYTIEREIGRGGMSIVYLARDLRNERRVALKVLRPDLAQALGPDRFLREIKVAAGLTHPHILPLFDSGVADGLLFYTMPYVEGESLRHRLIRHRRLRVADALAIAQDVADALSYAHAQNIVHRDIKPENILLEAGHAVVSDFGIARAISAANEARMTGTGIVVGTVEYMSPEQAGGEAVDGRSDVYSLACVLHEMLLGRTPFDDRISSGGRPAVSEERAGIPLELDVAIQTALAAFPSERFASAAEFAAALKAVPADVMSSRHWLQRVRRRWRSGLAVAALVALAAVLILPKVLGAGLNPALYVVVPFGHRDGAAPTLFKGDQCELRLYEELDRWSDVKTVDRFLVSSERQRRGEQLPDLREAMRIARAVGSGMLIWGELWQDGDSVGVRGALYDTRGRGRLLRAHTIRLGPDLQNIDVKFRELTDSLLLGRVQPHAAQAARSAGSVAAWLAYARGDEALQRWALNDAAAAFTEALTVNPSFPQANLWLAQTRAWTGLPASDWLGYATRALAARDSLSETDREVARGLVALAQSRYPDACDAYRRLVVLDPNDFVGWFGLGECQARDRLVIRSSTSPSGWAFRSSQQAAIDAYARALELVPVVHRAFGGVAYGRLAGLFYVEGYHSRGGYALAPDTVRFAARPALVGDTLAFVPQDLAAFLAAAPGTVPPSWPDALAHNRATLREITLTWMRAFPEDAAALETHARALETVGELAGGAPDRSALEAIRAARLVGGAGGDSLSQLTRAVAEVRILVKLERFAEARALGDSLLRAWPGPDPAVARRLAGLAALNGRINRAAALLAAAADGVPFTTPEGEQVPLPEAVAAPARALVAYAAAGAPAESVSAFERRVTVLVGTWVAPAHQPAGRRAALHVSAALAFPQMGIRDAHRGPAGGNYLLSLQSAMARGDVAAVRSGIAAVDRARGGVPAGDVTIQHVYHEAWLLAAVGDTAGAIFRLDRSLGALASLGSALVDEVPQAAGLVRAMALRADLAAAMGDQRVAARWARGVLALWRDADPDVGAVVSRMEALER